AARERRAGGDLERGDGHGRAPPTGAGAHPTPTRQRGLRLATIRAGKQAMAFTVREFRDMVRLMEEHPEWRAEMRRLVLSDELLALPDEMRQLRAVVEAL